MKQRKLFAILTLVAFMMTLLPMAAFAADRFNSKVEWDKTKVAVTNVADATDVGTDVYKADNRIKVQVYTFQGTNLQGGQDVYVASERGAIDYVEQKNGADVKINATTNEFKVTSNANGVAEFYVYSGTAGETDIAIGLTAGEVYKYLMGLDKDNVTINTAGIIDVETLTFETSNTEDVQVKAVYSKTEDSNISAPYNKEVANSVDYYEVTFKVAATSGAPVYDETIEFSLNKSGAFLNKTSAKTNVAGEAKVKVYADKPGTYTLEGKVGDEEATVDLKFNAGGVVDLAIDGTPDKLTAKDADYSFKLKLMDINGNKYSVVDATDATTQRDALEFDVVTEPEDSSLEETDFVPTVDNGLLKLTIKGNNLKYEGDYEVKISTDSGKSVVVPFTVKKQGTVTKLTLEYDEKAIALEGTTAAPEVKHVDAEGIKKNANLSNVKFSVNDTRLGTIGTDGKFTATDEDKYAGKVAVITAVDTDKNLVATAEIKIGSKVSGIKVATASANVNEEATIDITLVDADGEPISLANLFDDIEVNAYALTKPANALVSVDESSKFEKEMNEDGQSYIKVSSNKVGEVLLQVVVTAKETGKNDVYFTDSAVITFGTPKAETPGAGKVTLFIGQQVAVVDGEASVLDVAPFIKDGRTFVPVRFIAEALGAEVKYDAATQVVTATRGDDVVVMTIGSNVMTVNGEAQVTDVAPFIVDGRTVLPFRALAEAFGSEVAWDAATQSVVFEK